MSVDVAQHYGWQKKWTYLILKCGGQMSRWMNNNLEIFLPLPGETSLDGFSPYCGECQERGEQAGALGGRSCHCQTSELFQRHCWKSHLTISHPYTFDHGYCSPRRFRNRRHCLLRTPCSNSVRHDPSLTFCLTGPRWPRGFQALPRWHQCRRQGLLQGWL